MASAGNPNQTGAFDLHKFFKPSNANAPISPSYPTPPTAYPTPPPQGPYSYPPQTHPTFQHYLHYPHDPLTNMHAQRPVSYPAPTPNLPPPNPNSGARLMALLSPNPSANLEASLTAPSPQVAVALTPAVLPSAPPQPTPVRLPSSKLPKGRHLIGDRLTYDIDVRLPGEVQPQLEVTPITKYVSDPGLVLGRQIAVNRTYICYGLKLGAIRVLNINTALRSLLRGHTQRVTDMAFFAEDVHLLASSSIDGRIFVWKINEGPDEEDKPQITGKAVVAIHLVGDRESYQPRVCWHCHKQEILVVAIGNWVLKIDSTKVGKGESFSAEEPIKCLIEKWIDGVQLVGKHEGEVTDLSMCQWMTTRLVSASTDGTIKIWEDRKAMPLATLRPHDSQPVYSVTFLTSPHRPDQIVLITAGYLNRELKVWASAGEEGWLLPSDSESWHCTQTLELISSNEPRAEEAFFNQVVLLPRAGLILLANAKKNAIYVVHIEYGPHPAATCMDYIAEFTVTMPILSLTGTSDYSPDEEHAVQVYCVQTQAIQQYALDLSQCLPPPLENAGGDKDSGVSHVSESSTSDGFAGISKPIPLVSSSERSAVARYPVFSGPPEVSNLELATSGTEPKLSALPSPNTEVVNLHVASPPLPSSPRLSGRLSGFRSPSNNLEPGLSIGDRSVDPPVSDYSVDRRVDSGCMNLTDVPSLDENSVKDGNNPGRSDISVMPNPPTAFKHPTHLITPEEILSITVSSSESIDVAQSSKGGETEVQDSAVNNEIESVELEVKVVGESGLNQQKDFDSQREQRILHTEKKERIFFAQASDLVIDMAGDSRSLSAEIPGMEGLQQMEDAGVADFLEQRPSRVGEQGVQGLTKDVPGKVTESSAIASAAAVQPPSAAAKGKKQKAKPSHVAGSFSPSSSLFNSMDSLNEPGSMTGVPSMEATYAQIQAIQENVNQLMTMQKEMQKQMTAMVSAPVNKEGRRLETALGRNMEKTLKSNSDALWARLQEENAKQKLERDRIQQTMSSISGSMSKDWPAMLEKILKKEIATVGTTVTRAITPNLEKTISSAIADSFQRGVGDKAVNQLEKLVNSKLEATVAKQIQAQFQTAGKQILQDALRSSLEALVIPAFEQACKAMFEQVDALFRKGLVEHTSAAQQHFESTHSPLALALRDAMNSASSITQSLSGELADGQRNLLALVATGANQKVINPMAGQQSNGPLAGIRDMALSVQQVEAPLDPTKELQRLISEHKYEEAFTSALQRSDVSIVSWLCSQVDLQGILSTIPLPLSQGVLLSLLQQLACDLGNETPKKLDWMKDIAVAIDPTDHTIALHVRPILEQVYHMLGHQRTLPSTTAAEANSSRLVMHVINSVLMSYK